MLLQNIIAASEHQIYVYLTRKIRFPPQSDSNDRNSSSVSRCVTLQEISTQFYSILLTSSGNWFKPHFDNLSIYIYGLAVKSDDTDSASQHQPSRMPGLASSIIQLTGTRNIQWDCVAYIYVCYKYIVDHHIAFNATDYVAPGLRDRCDRLNWRTKRAMSLNGSS